MSEPKPGNPVKKIWLFDRRDYWRRVYSQVLETAGYTVRSSDRYTYPPENCSPGEQPDLAVLACTIVEEEERHLVQRAAVCEDRILILAASLPQQVIRSLFLSGAFDVNVTPSDTCQLVALVTGSLSRFPHPTAYETFLSRVSQ